MSNNTSDSEGVAGVGMMIAAYVDEMAADRSLDSLKQARKQGSLYFDDAVVVRQDAKGKVHINETGDMRTGKGAGIGGLIGGLIGLIGGPAGMALGAATGAAIGGMAAHHDAGFSQDSLKELGGALVPGSSAILATTSKDFVEEVRRQTPDTERMATAREISSAIHAALQARKDVLFGLAITESGVVATQVVSSPSEVAVFGIQATEEGVVAGGAVATPEGAAYKVAAASDEGSAAQAGVVTPEGTVIVNAQAPDVGDDGATAEDEPVEDS